MYGAIIGDIIGSPFEFDTGERTKDFPLLSPESQFTDDTVMTIAVADALLNTYGKRESKIKEALVESMRRWALKYPHAGYGLSFCNFLFQNPVPYNSYGNGSAMRVSSVGWMFPLTDVRSLDNTSELARITAEVSHNHPEGVKGAMATADAIFLARLGIDKSEIISYTETKYGYDLSRTCADIRETNIHIETCQASIPIAFAAFYESSSFEDTIRNAVSMGGDCDTNACIAGSIAEAYYENKPGAVRAVLKSACLDRLPDDIRLVLYRFDEFRRNMR